MGRITAHVALHGLLGITLVTAVPVMAASPSAAAPKTVVDRADNPPSIAGINRALRKERARLRKGGWTSLDSDAASHSDQDADSADDDDWPDDADSDSSSSVGNVLSSDPCTNPAVGTAPAEVAATSGEPASITLQKGADGPTVSETLAGVGSRAATDVVASVEKILDRCPVIEDDSVRTTYSRWPTPELGDASVGYKVTIESKTADEPAVSFTSAVVAEDGVLAHYTMTDGDAKDTAEFKGIVKSGAKGLDGIGE